MTEREAETDRDRDRDARDAAALDALLDERAARLAQPARALVRARRTALRLSIGTDRVLIPAGSALAIAPLAALTPVPFAGEHVAGLTARRGRAIPVFHLRVLLGLPLSRLPETSCVVVLDAPGEPALAVDSVEDDDLPDDGALGAPPETVRATTRALLRGTTEDGRLVLDVEALLRSPLTVVDAGPRAARR